MTHALALLAVLLAAVLVLSACGRAPQGPDTVLVGTRSGLCQGIAQFRLATVGLTAGASAATSVDLRAILDLAVQRLQALAAEPSVADSARQDLATVSGGFSQIEKTLAASGAANAQAVVGALVAFKQDDNVTAAASRLDTVARHTCGYNTEGPATTTTSTTLGPTTTVALAGATATP